MKRLSIACVLLVAGLATAQDMPLHEIIKPGEEWKPFAGEMPSREKCKYHIDLKDRPFTLDNEYLAGKDRSYELKEPLCGILTLDGSTFLVADAADRHVWAIRRAKDGSLNHEPADRYCRMRVRGDDRRTKNTPAVAYRADPSAMTIDGANRLYVATNLGIQVFDPTGRLCGVFTSPPGRLTALTFDSDRMFASTGDKNFVRQMNATGSKASK